MNKLFLIFSLVFLFQSNSIFAQKGDRDKLFKSQIDSIRRQKFIEKINIDESTAESFFTMFKENNKKIRIFNKERRQILEKIEENPEAFDIDDKINSLLDIETKITEQKRIFMTELKTILTPQQIAKTIIFQRNFQKQFRKEMIKQRNERQKD